MRPEKIKFKIKFYPGILFGVRNYEHDVIYIDTDHDEDRLGRLKELVLYLPLIAFTINVINPIDES